jgi:hypothetical protein
MQTLLAKLIVSAGGGHLVEYALVALGISAALVNPSLAMTVLRTVTDALRALLLQVAMVL